MPLEASVTKIEDLNASWPSGEDDLMHGDDHIRNIKTALRSLLTDITQLPLPILVAEAPTGAVPGTAYTLSLAPVSAAKLHLFRNGMMLRGPGQGGTQYTCSGVNITLASATLSGDWLWALYEV